MAWITFTEEHVKARLMDEELEAYENAGDIDVETKLAGIIEQVVGLVRGKAASCHKVTTLGAAGTIPEELLWSAATIGKDSLIAVVPGMDEEQDKLRMEEYRRAMDQLDDAADCKIFISSGIDGTTGAVSGSSFGGSPILAF